MIAFNTGSGADVVTVDAGAMQDLTDKIHQIPANHRPGVFRPGPRHDPDR